MFLVIGDIWYYFKWKLGFIWEGNINIGKNLGIVKIYVRFFVD